MMHSSSDEDEVSSKKTLQGGRETAGSSREGTGRVSPRTMQAIQRALMEDSNISEDLCKKVPTPQKKYVIVSSSDDDDDEAEGTVMKRSVGCEEQEGGGVSPRTLLAIQKALGNKYSFPGIKQVERGGLLSSSEEEEMEEVVGVRGREFKAAALNQEERHEQSALKAFPRSELQSDEGTSPRNHEPGSETSFPQEGGLSMNLSEEKEDRNREVMVRSDEEDSSSEGM